MLLIFLIGSRLLKIRVPQWVLPLPGYAIGGIASFWFVTRLLDIVA